ncbi:MAG: TerB family tellurite resistance protein [Pseudomonadota bacterium]|nr:TerB family tellurite resistance protein [Pseudomonadota bacterium]MEC8020189.1 TerB family tellurite resistance protein [Pseudomonadota bacterium]MEC8498099.1 TerB family tellurite resistance protein [Pseudomonadota bacterium]|tara:strand:- start:1729 stop:2193 length:465 start_codon:yes stop_codon:yes gene_type:complete
MKKFIEKLFRRKSVENKNEDLTSSSLIEEAVAVLLLRAANIDGKKDAKEIDAIKKLIIKQFNYDEQKTNALIDSASDKEESSTDLFEWSKIINDHYDLDSKKIVFSMMCEIICADGLIDPFESNFIRRLSGLLYISDKEAGIIKKQVMKEKDMQ